MIGLKKCCKKNQYLISFFLPVLLMGFFLFDVPSAHAIGEAIRTGFFWVLNMILYAVFLVVALLVDLAVSVLGAVVDAEMVERLFNMEAI